MLAKKYVCVLFLLLFIVLPLECCWGEGVNITFPPQSYVNGNVVKLGDIAKITGTDKARIEILRSLLLGEAPSPGNSYTLDQNQMGAWLMATGADFSGIEFNMPASIVIRATAQVVQDAVIKKAVEQAIRSDLNTGGDVVIHYLDNIAGEVVAGGGKAVVSAKLQGGVRFNGITSVNVGFVVDGVIFSKRNIRCEVSVFKNVLVANRAMTKGTVMTESDLKSASVEILNAKNEYIAEAAQLIGKALKKDVAEGEAITAKMVVLPFAVKRGQAVVIIARSGELEITSSGTALQDGAVGQMIRVENTTTKKQLTAKVIDGQTVVIEI